MSEPDDIYASAADCVAHYRATVHRRPVARPVDFDTIRDGFGTGSVPLEPTPPETVLDDLVRAADPGITATVGPRYFGFVIGGSLSSATAADILALGWDQPAFNATLAPAAIAVEQVAGRWAKELLGIPESASVGFVTGAQEANTVGLAAARHHVLKEHGWDVEQDGLQGAPRVRVIVGDERHGTVDRTLRLLGLGISSAVPVRTDANGAIDVEHLEEVLAASEGPTIVCLQSGNVNTGACDDLERSCAAAHAREAWVHVDGAFGLWAAASPELEHLTRGVGDADSWGCDAHKWLNVPYDSGLVFVTRPDIHAAAVSYVAAYLVGSGQGTVGGSDFVIGSSRRARGFAVWAAIRELGRNGVAELVERNCALARRFADQLKEAGAEIANEVVLNQVLVGFGDDATTDAVIEAVQRDGTCWMGGTTWRGRRYMRISVSNHATTEDDVDRSVEAVLRCWRR
ncbi:pyridoxal phosphate-dependent decarboxylase family protein [Aeromicrobium sp.]|uniref:pyridoxal phosphate-dependent decarboxylase family protein n=1 Tax=Aeromicrobium sp. TaxID=1871063 RepID=UPI003C31DEA7